MSLLPTIGAVESGGLYNGVATQSLRLNDNDSAYIHRTPGSASNRRTWTYSFWYKRGNLTTSQNQAFFSAGNSSSDFTMLYIDGTTDDLRWYDYDGSTDYGKAYDIFLRDTASWYHIVYAFDTTQSTDANKVKVYVNGTQQTVIKTDYGWMPTDYQTRVNDAKKHNIGKYTGNNEYVDGYLAEINFVDGTQLTADSFGETKNGVWIPKKYTGSYGTQGFHLEFKETGDGSSTASSSTIGADTANSNHFKDVNLDAYDSNMPDSPENNFPTWNTNAPDPTYSITTISEGDLKSQNTAANNKYSEITFQLDQTNKYYFEYYNIDATTPVKPASFELFASSTNKFSLYITNAGNIYLDGSSIGSSFPVLGAGDIVNIAFDGASGKIWLAKNGTYYNASGSATGNPADGSNPIATVTSATFKMTSTFYQQGAIMNFGQDSTFAGNKTSGSENAQDANGIGDFYDTVPSGFLALCSANLPEPTIGPNSGTNEQADDYFNTVLYTGNDSTNNITGVGFQPDWVWVKKRSTAGDHKLIDSLRGVGQALESNTTDIEADESSSFTAFGADGFSLAGTAGAWNEDTETYVAWNWKAGGEPSADNSAGADAVPTAGSAKIDGSNATASFAGTIPITRLSANTTAGFSIVTYTGTGSAGTINHGLSATPNCIIVMGRNVSNTNPYIQDGITGVTDPFTDYIAFGNVNGVLADDATMWNDVAPDGNVFTVGTGANTNQNTKTYVAYLFSNVEGYSKFGSYTGGGSVFPFVYTGFRPAWLMIKKSSAGGTSWQMYDNKRDIDNVVENRLIADNSNDEGAGSDKVDFLSNGFKLRANTTTTNFSATYIYMAFAEAPFKYANAR